MREEEKKQTSPNSKMQRFFRKRWVFPAIYLIAAAIILTGVLWYQNSGGVSSSKHKENGTKTSQSEPAVPVNKAVENFAMPVLNQNDMRIAKEFYESDAPKEKQEAALVYYDHTYYPNKGVDIAMKDGKSFDVVASLSGVVSKAEKDPTLGYVVEIQHEKGVVTVYQSLADVQVKAGDTVEQGAVIAKASQNVYDKDAGIHVHFEIRKNGTPVNPLSYMDKPLTSLDNLNQDNAQVESKDGQVDGNSGQLEDSTNQSDNTSNQSSESPDASISMARA